MFKAVMDIECYVNYFLVMFKQLGSGNVKYFELHEDCKFDIDGVQSILDKFEIITFNGIGYDIPMLSLAMNNASNERLKNASDAIITQDLKWWQFSRKFGAKLIECDHIDLIEVAPGMASLKIYGGRIHSKKMQDLPIEPSALISPSDRIDLREYCINDLDTTRDLYDRLTPQIQIRRDMSVEYGLELRSKSDAQIAEAVIKKEVSKILGREVIKGSNAVARTFYYEKPEFIKFQSTVMQEALELVMDSPFVVSDKGKITMTKDLQSLRIPIGSSVYQMGMGGLHSTEKEVCYVADDKHVLIDRDVASYYPAIILNLGLYPKNLGTPFLKVYKDIVDRRLLAKKAGDKVTADMLKIVVNGSYGKLGSVYSSLYAPHLMIQTTLTGQLALLMLIEMMEKLKIPVVSANTDGVLMYCPIDKVETLNKVITAWEKHTGYDTEETCYSGVYSRDVNNYIAVLTDGTVKSKGCFASPSLDKNAPNSVCSDAVKSHLKTGTNIEEYVRACTDIRKFITVRTVKGGAIKDDGFLGKAIRWYYAKGEKDVIRYKLNGNTVPRSKGAKPLMELPDDLPDDIDYEWYISECHDMLMDLGVIKRPVYEKVPRKNTKLWKKLKEEGLIELDDEGKKTLWVVPEDHLIED